ncbi:MAG: formyltransferase family protein, partial [Winogradskyella arenosi]
MVTLFLLGKKGLITLSDLKEASLKGISKVIIGKDKNVVNDYSDDIIRFCEDKNINYCDASVQNHFDSKYAFAIGWKKIIDFTADQKLIVFHDSILPRLRGFNPLVTALINGDNEIGVTALFATQEYDRGDIIEIGKMAIKYPIKINDALNLVSDLYAKLANNIIETIMSGKELRSTKQVESEATYSLWRNQEDYRIDWTASSEKIARHINAVGFPYTGATTLIEGKEITIVDSEPMDDVVIENRT